MLARIALTAGMSLVACRQASLPTRYDGVVVDVRAASFLQIASFTLRTADGALVEMTVRGDVGITQSHLREHMALAEPVSVSVRYEDGLTIATQVDDLPPP